LDGIRNHRDNTKALIFYDRGNAFNPPSHVKVAVISSSGMSSRKVESTISTVNNIALFDERTPERFPTIACLGRVFAGIIGGGLDVV
jgi:hypothetical protein